MTRSRCSEHTAQQKQVLSSRIWARGQKRARKGDSRAPTTDVPQAPFARPSDALSVRACGTRPQKQVARAPGAIPPPRRPVPPSWGRASSPAPRKSRKAAAATAGHGVAQKGNFNMIRMSAFHTLHVVSTLSRSERRDLLEGCAHALHVLFERWQQRRRRMF